MARERHYVPRIPRDLVGVLYRERIRRGIPMTRLVEEILTDALRETESWKLMDEERSYRPGQSKQP